MQLALTSSLSSLSDIVGSSNLLTDPKDLEPYTRAEFPVERRVLGVLRPSCRSEVQQLVRAASAMNVSLYPISTGKNWGYGSANPTRDDCLLLDMSRMDSIQELNRDLAYVVVQPGVTQQILYDYLEANAPELMMDPTGSGPSCSVLGNNLERGYGITPAGDHFSHVCGLEAVLADGSILRTGFSHFEGSRVSRVFKWGVGPYLDGIFTQSNLGVVTSMGVWLMPKPEHFEACYFTCKNDEDIFPLIDEVRWLLQHKVIRGSVNFAHRNRTLTMLMQYPWDEMQGKTPLDPNLALRLAQEHKIGAWNGLFAVYGTKEEARAAKKVIKRRMRSKTQRLQFVSRPLLRFMELFPGPLSFMTRLNIRELVRIIQPSFDILSGKPSEVSLTSPFWRSRRKPPTRDIDPVKDGCGLYWLAPVVPMIKEDAREFIDMVHATVTKHGFEPCIMFSTVTDRCFDCNLPILFDRDNAEEARRAEECYLELYDACMRGGFIPYRVGIQSMEDLTSRGDETFWNVVRSIKTALDPTSTIAPGRYCP